MENPKIKTIGLAKENESPENPGSLEKRVALIPMDVEKLVHKGFQVFFEKGCGLGIGFSDQDYQDAGAILQDHNAIYSDKDMVIKFKGPALEDIRKMRPKTVLFCMAHFHSYPDRAQLLKDCKINVVAMEEIRQSPNKIPDQIIASKVGMQRYFNQLKESPENFHIGFLGYSDDMVGAIRRACNRSPITTILYGHHATLQDIEYLGVNTIYVYDSKYFHNEILLKSLQEKQCHLFDLREFIEKKGSSAVVKYKETHPPFEYGGRKIQCLHETGRAGCRYGFHLATEVSHKIEQRNQAQVTILGYGNVGMGAIHEAFDQDVKKIRILGKRHTSKESITSFIQDADVIVNGAEQPRNLRGKNFLISNDHLKNVLQKGTAVIDLVGGSATNRSPVEPVIACTFLTDPHFEQDGIFVSALWGWPMMGMMKESAVKYSEQILDVLVNDDQLLYTGIENPSKPIQGAIVCGVF